MVIACERELPLGIYPGGEGSIYHTGKGEYYGPFLVLAVATEADWIEYYKEDLGRPPDDRELEFARRRCPFFYRIHID